MATFTKFDVFTENLAEGVHNLGSNTLKVMLTNSAPLVTNTVKANLTEISAGKPKVVDEWTISEPIPVDYLASK